MKPIALLIYFFLASVNLITAQLTGQWTKTFGSSSPYITFPFKAFTDNSGNVYCSVFSYFNISSDIGDTLWILKYDSQGNLIWNVPLKNGDGSLATDFKLDADSNILVLLSNFQSGFPLSRNFNIVKMDTTGSIIWDKNINDSLNYSHSNLISLIPGSSDVIITSSGRTSSSAMVVYARRIDANGNQVWRYTDSMRTDPGPQCVDSHGYFHFTSQKIIGLSQQRVSYKKLDLNGLPIDSFTLDHGYASYCKDEKNIFVNDSGNVFLNIAAQASQLNISHELLLELDANADSLTSFEDLNLITKYMTYDSVSGKILLSMAEGTNFTPLRSSIGAFNSCNLIDTTAYAENVHVVNQFLNSDGELLVLNYFDRICKFNPDGTLLWSYVTPQFVSTIDQDRFFYKIIQDNNSKAIYYLYADKINVTDDHGVWHITKYFEDSLLSRINTDEVISSVEAFPNPASDNIQMNFNGPEYISEILITDLSGSVLFNSFPHKTIKNYSIDLSKLNSGFYMIKMIGDKKNFTTKLMLEK